MKRKNRNKWRNGGNRGNEERVELNSVGENDKNNKMNEFNDREFVTKISFSGALTTLN